MPLGTPIKLTDIVQVMKNKWVFGDKFFGYTEEFNDNHNTQYPSMLITPPTSVFPEVGLNNGWEEYTFEIYFSDLYNRTAQANEEIDQRWENLQDLATEWLDEFLKFYQDTAPILAFLEDESVMIERSKEVANDQLLQLKLTFTWRVMSMCFRPQSTSPNQIANLAVWLRADSGTTYSTPTKKVSAWADQSGNSNDVSASGGTTTEPLRYTYDGASDKTRIEFDGTADSFVSDANCPITTDFTIFTVAQAAPVTPTFTNTYATHFELSNAVCEVNTPTTGGASGLGLFSFTDNAGTDQPFSFSVWANIDPLQPWRGFVEKNEVGQQEYTFRVEYGSGNTLFHLYTNTGAILGKRVSTVFPKGEWVHAVCTYDGTSTNAGMKIYFDGVLQFSTAANSGVYTGMSVTTAPFDIGNGGGNPMFGDIDEVSVFDSELSQAEITELYNLGNPTDVATSTPNANLIGWWRMGDGATYPTIPDVSTNSNDGTLLNMSAEDIRAFAPNSEASAYFTYEFGNVNICLGSSSERLYCHVSDTTNPPTTGEWNARYIWDGDASQYHIATMQLDSVTTNLLLQYNNTTLMEGTMAAYTPGTTYNGASFILGQGTHLGYLEGNIQEVIVYNRAITAAEIETVKDYLNNKYQIY